MKGAFRTAREGRLWNCLRLARSYLLAGLGLPAGSHSAHNVEEKIEKERAGSTTIKKSTDARMMRAAGGTA